MRHGSKTMTTEHTQGVDQLRDRLKGLVSEQAQILATAQAASRELTDEEKTKMKEVASKRDALEDEIHIRIDALEAQARLDEMDKPQASPVSSDIAHARAAAPAPAQRRGVAAPTPITGRDLAAESPTHGFATAQDWFKAIRVAAVNPSIVDRRLTNAQAAATVFANEGAGPEGGWSLPPEYSKEIVEAVAGQASLLGRMKPIQSTSNIFQIPVDETTQWGTTGVQAAKVSEGGAATATVLALQGRTVTLYKAVSLVNVTEELATDNPASVQYINRVMGRQLQGIVERWILRGSGVGEPVGILNAPGLVSVTAESAGNGAGTLIRKNLAKCCGRLLPGYDSEAFFCMSPSALIEVNEILLAVNGNSRDDLTRGFSQTVLGKPIHVSMEAQPVGTAGDATCIAPSGFLTLVKGGVQSQATIYFYFDQGLQTLRSYLRIGQVPLLSAPVTPKLDTSTTLSHCVTTATRVG